jgi:hypothetical protein
MDDIARSSVDRAERTRPANDVGRRQLDGSQERPPASRSRAGPVPRRRARGRGSEQLHRIGEPERSECQRHARAADPPRPEQRTPRAGRPSSGATPRGWPATHRSVRPVENEQRDAARRQVAEDRRRIGVCPTNPLVVGNAFQRFAGGAYIGQVHVEPRSRTAPREVLDEPRRSDPRRSRHGDRRCAFEPRALQGDELELAPDERALVAACRGIDPQAVSLPPYRHEMCRRAGVLLELRAQTVNDAVDRPRVAGGSFPELATDRLSRPHLVALSQQSEESHLERGELDGRRPADAVPIEIDGAVADLEHRSHARLALGGLTLEAVPGAFRHEQARAIGSLLHLATESLHELHHGVVVGAFPPHGRREGASVDGRPGSAARAWRSRISSRDRRTVRPSTRWSVRAPTSTTSWPTVRVRGSLLRTTRSPTPASRGSSEEEQADDHTPRCCSRSRSKPPSFSASGASSCPSLSGPGFVFSAGRVAGVTDAVAIRVRSDRNVRCSGQLSHSSPQLSASLSS